MILEPVNGSRHDVSVQVHDKSTQLDHKGRTPAERHALFMTGFTNILRHEGLRSPGYYHDKSQCISFQDCTPAEMGIIKAERLKWGYVEPRELAKRLRQLKPSHNFTTRKCRFPRILWDKSPIPDTPPIEDIPEAHWFWDQKFGIWGLKRRLGESLTKHYEDEVQNYWDRLCNIELAPVPDIYFLTHINHSPSGTLFPRYLVKALWELLDAVHKRGLRYYYDKGDRAKIKREEIIRQWQINYPSEILADDVLSIYRTWPPDLMARLDEVDREAIREGRKLYMADLENTGQKMQELVAFWRNCGLVTGTRTPPSPQWPDFSAKLRELLAPHYFHERRHAIEAKFGNGSEGQKRTMIERARWKEAVLHAHFDPATSELRVTEPVLLRNRIFLTGNKCWREWEPSEKQKRVDIWKSWELSELPITQPLLQKLEVVWKSWEDIWNKDDAEDEMVDILCRWRRGQEDEPCSGTSSAAPELDGRTDIPCSKPSRSDIRALTDGLQFLRKHPSKRKPRGHNALTMNNTWHGRLRPMFEPQGTLRRQLRRPRQITQNLSAYHEVERLKPSGKHLPISRAGKSRVCKIPAILLTNSGSQHFPVMMAQILPSAITPKRTAAQHSSEQVKNGKTQSFVRGVQKSSKAQSKSFSKRRRSVSDESTRKFLRLLTPSTSE